MFGASLQSGLSPVPGNFPHHFAGMWFEKRVQTDRQTDRWTGPALQLSVFKQTRRLPPH